MECFENYGSDLAIDHGWMYCGSADKTVFHMHPSYELLYIPSGVVAETIVDSRTVHTEYPVIVITAPFCRHFTYYEKIPGVLPRERKPEWWAFYVGDGYYQGLPERLPPMSRLTGGANARFFDITGVEEQFIRVIELIKDLQERFEHRMYDANFTQKLAFGILITLLEKQSGRQEKPDITVRENNYVLDIVHYITNRLGEKLNTEDISHHFFVSRDKLNRDFRAYTGMSVRDFIMLSRLNMAKHLLQVSSLTVGQIAEQCGFENEIYFYAFFKKHMGSTPREYQSKQKHR